ncbi:lasso peptide isopeptide bond-forming cyclase [Chloroflexi bacterium TSY]|nr:lasso peptide isopeptide bond-forming cyclase [Chloroflexi bacterium TSY]
MSGIVGFVSFDGQATDRQMIERMSSVLAHRGPDDRQVWTDRSIGLGHCMLRTTPESVREVQPLVDRRTQTVITADARIDNRKELFSTLKIASDQGAVMSDSELILATYHKWGERCPEKLLGVFAFAIWDFRQNKLFCVRDHLGIKPFYYYYYHPSRFFAFGSEIKALLSIPEIPRRLNEVMVGNYLAAMLEDTEHTFYQDILRLPPAHTLCIKNHNIQIEHYWLLEPKSLPSDYTDSDYSEAFQELFSEAVRCRLRSTYPIGSSLSGGLDSSSVVCIARNELEKESRQPLHTFSYVYDDLPQCDERQYIQSVLDQGQMVPHLMQGTQAGPLVDSEQILKQFDEAVIGPNLYLFWNLHKAAQNTGVRILLDGFDGDTIVSHGLYYLSELAYKREWTEFTHEATLLAQNLDMTPLSIFYGYGARPLWNLIRSGRPIAFAHDAQKISRHFDITQAALWKQVGIKPLLPYNFQKAWRQLRKQKPLKQQMELPIHHQFARRIQFDERMAARRKSEPVPHTLDEQHLISLKTGELAYILEFCDKTAAAFSLEARHPFMDKRLVFTFW